MTTFFQAITDKFVTDHNVSVEYNKELPGKGDYLCGKAGKTCSGCDVTMKRRTNDKPKRGPGRVQGSKG